MSCSNRLSTVSVRQSIRLQYKLINAFAVLVYKRSSKSYCLHGHHQHLHVNYIYRVFSLMKCHVEYIGNFAHFGIFLVYGM